MLEKHRLDGGELVLVGKAGGLVRRDRDHVAAAGRTQHQVVGGKGAVLERPLERRETLDDQAPQLADASGTRCRRHRVFDLIELVKTQRRQDPIARSDALAGGGVARSRRVESLEETRSVFGHQKNPKWR